MSDNPGASQMTRLQAAIFFLEVAVLEQVCQPGSERCESVRRRSDEAQRLWNTIRAEARGKPQYFSAEYIRRFDKRFKRVVLSLLHHASDSDTPRVDWDRLSGEQMLVVTEAYEIHRRRLRRSVLNLMSDAHDFEEQLEAARGDNGDASGLAGYVPADTLDHDEGVRPSRLSEAKRDGLVKSKPAPAGMLDTQGRKVRLLYHRGDALKYCKPKHVKEKTRRSALKFKRK